MAAVDGVLTARLVDYTPPSRPRQWIVWPVNRVAPVARSRVPWCWRVRS